MTATPTITRDGFADFYTELQGHPPFQWQIDLANHTFENGWPDIIDVPTASGKTAAIDIAVYAAALSAVDPKVSAARRIFFTVDRRQVVSQAFSHADQIANRLWDAAKTTNNDQPEILRQVAACLLKLGGNFDRQPPLDARELRGGIFRDDAWVRTPTQPTVIATTVDQIGSRILFRGYGVSNRNLPIHAAMTATDALILLDEAHCSVPFLQTVEMVQQYQGERWAEEPLATPLRLVQMSATNVKSKTSKTIFRLSDDHYAADAKLRQRHEASKPVKLVLDDKAKTKTPAAKVAAKLISEALKLADAGCRRIAIIVNRVGVAKAVHELLSAKHETHLLIGRMRPIDRDDLTERLNQRFASGAKSVIDESDAPVFLVATQTIEVGVDYDFDGMVSQCASLDALIQRFGRLNRIGNHPHSQGVIVANASDATDKLDPAKPIDPIYGNASAATYSFLRSQAGESEVVDFGVRIAGSILAEGVERPETCFVTRAVAPVLMPAHVDMLVQTSPRPALEPDVAMYLHGLGPDGKPPGQPMVQLCWRADLSMPSGPWDAESTDDPITRFRSQQTNWKRALEACPPSAPECMSVPLAEFQRWMAGQMAESRTGDVEGELVVDEEKPKPEPKPWLRRVAIVWRGPGHSNTDRSNSDAAVKSKRNRDTAIVGGDAGDVYRNLRPNDTVVIPSQFGGWSFFGTIPDPVDDPSIEWKGIAKLLGPQPSAPERTRTEQLLANIGQIDIGDRAFFEKRCRNILRLHDKLPLGTAETSLLAWIRSEVEVDGQFNLLVQKTRDALEAICSSSTELNGDSTKSWQAHRLGRLCDDSLTGQLTLYPGGYVWTTGIDHDKRIGIPPLPMESFDDQLDSRSGTREVDLQRHTADVMHVARVFATAIAFSPDRIDRVLTAALWHDIGKADPRFQAILLGQSVSLSRFAPTLLAKSSSYGRSPVGTLPSGFRHEMLSMQVFEQACCNSQIDKTQLDESGSPRPVSGRGVGGEGLLVAHLIASHHGFARPMAPVCLEEELPEIDLSPVSGPIIGQKVRQSWTPAHQLDSGVPDRFWRMNQRHGAWGLAQLESVLRLSDWYASANSHIGDEQPEWTWPTTFAPFSACVPREVVCNGIDGGNPFGFLSALGMFRALQLGQASDRFRFHWKHHNGGWRPVIVDLAEKLVDESSVINLLVDRLLLDTDSHPSLIDCPIKTKRHDWFEELASSSSLLDRIAADWVTCNGSDALGPEAISQLQTSRRDYHAIAIKGLLAATTVDHLHRTLFEPWDYADPIAGVSLHLEPREDRRHAYQWHTPSGDPTRKVNGGMMGANRLALEAWPLFQSLPRIDRMQTVGFRGWRVSDTTFLWPLWGKLISLAAIRSLLNSHQSMDSKQRAAIGIGASYSSKRILVGKTPNLTAAVAVN